MTERQRAKWEVLRRKGPFWFVLRYGILQAGLIFATLTTISNYLGLFGVHWHGAKAEAFHFIFRAFFFGIILGWWAWHYRERQFTRAE